MTLETERQMLEATGYQDRAGVLVGPRCPREIADLISLDRPILLSARQSGAPTVRVYRNVARDAVQAADELLSKLDIYVKHLIPSESVLVDALRATDNRNTYQEHSSGEEFNCAFASIDLRTRQQALYLTMAVGASTKLDKSRNSPVALNLADCVAKARPSLVFGKRSDRLMRQGWGQAPFWAELEALSKKGRPAVVADGEEVWSNDPLGQAWRLLKGDRDRAQGMAIFKRTRDSMLRYTGEGVEMCDGHFDWYMPSYPPPGLTRIRVVGNHATGSISRLYLDSPANYPDVAVAQSPLPLAMDEHGAVADQVENLRWYLAHAGKPSWTVTDLGREMIRRGYATDATRRHGPAGGYRPGEEYTLQQTIWNNLELFETGRFTRALQGNTVTVTGVWPTDGQPWAAAGDFGRIRQWRNKLASVYAARTNYTFAGITGTVDGRPFSLIARPKPHPVTAGEVTINYTLEKPRSSRTSNDPGAERRQVYLLHDWIAEAILRALRRAQRVPVPVAVTDLDEAQLSHWHSVIQQAQQTVDDAERELRLLQHDINERIPGTDEHVMTARQRHQGRIRIDELIGGLPPLRDHVKSCERELADYAQRRAHEQRGIEAHKLADLLLSLLDPTDVTFRHMWKLAIRDLVVTSSTVNVAGSRGSQVEFTFTLLLTDADNTVAIPASGRHAINSLAHREHEARAMMTALRAGTPLDWESNDNGLTQRKVFRYLREEVLHLTDGRSAFMQCRVPDLLRLGMSALFPDDEGTPADLSKRLRHSTELAETFTRPDLLAERIQHIYPALSLRNGWLVRTSTFEVHALVVAAQNAGLVTRHDFASAREWHNFRWVVFNDRGDPHMSRSVEWTPLAEDRLTLAACRHCGSHHRALMGVRDVAGYVCLQCRHDSQGVTWPDALFDPYVREPALWNGLGYELPLPTDEHYVGRRWQQRSAGAVAPTATRPQPSSRILGARRRRRPLAEVSAAELAAAVAEYADKRPLRDVTAKHNLRDAELSAYLQERGILRTKPRPLR